MIINFVFLHTLKLAHHYLKSIIYFKIIIKKLVFSVLKFSTFMDILLLHCTIIIVFVMNLSLSKFCQLFAAVEKAAFLRLMLFSRHNEHGFSRTTAWSYYIFHQNLGSMKPNISVILMQQIFIVFYSLLLILSQKKKKYTYSAKLRPRLKVGSSKFHCTRPTEQEKNLSKKFRHLVPENIHYFSEIVKFLLNHYMYIKLSLELKWKLKIWI